MTYSRMVTLTLIAIITLSTAVWAENLTVCLNSEAAPYSQSERSGDEHGFDVLVAQAVARELQLDLQIRWFETKKEEDSSLFLEADALLMDEKCDFVAGYPLIEDRLGQPGMTSFRLPDFRGAAVIDRKRRVPMGPLLNSLAYHRVNFIAIKGPRVLEISDLNDLIGLRLTAEGGTFVDAVLMTYKSGLLIPKVVHTKPGNEEYLARLENDESDATLISLHKFDVYRFLHPNSKIVRSKFVYPGGINLGWVTTNKSKIPLEKVNDALRNLMITKELESLAIKAHMTYVKPEGPDVGAGLRFN